MSEMRILVGLIEAGVLAVGSGTDTFHCPVLELRLPDYGGLVPKLFLPCVHSPGGAAIYGREGSDKPSATNSRQLLSVNFDELSASLIHLAQGAFLGATISAGSPEQAIVLTWTGAQLGLRSLLRPQDAPAIVDYRGTLRAACFHPTDGRCVVATDEWLTSYDIYQDGSTLRMERIGESKNTDRASIRALAFDASGHLLHILRGRTYSVSDAQLPKVNAKGRRQFAKGKEFYLIACQRGDQTTQRFFVTGNASTAQFAAGIPGPWNKANISPSGAVVANGVAWLGEKHGLAWGRKWLSIFPTPPALAQTPPDSGEPNLVTWTPAGNMKIMAAQVIPVGQGHCLFVYTAPCLPGEMSPTS